MKKDFDALMELIPEQYIEEAAAYREAHSGAAKPRIRWLAPVSIAACAAACLGLAFFAHKPHSHDDLMIANSNVNSESIAEQSPAETTAQTVTEGAQTTETMRTHVNTMPYDTTTVTTVTTVTAEEQTNAPAVMTNAPADNNSTESPVTSSKATTEPTVSDDEKPDKAVWIRYEIPANTPDGDYYTILYDKNEQPFAIGPIFNPAYAAGIACFTVEGTGQADLTAVLVNVETGIRAAIGIYHVDFEKRTFEMRSGNVAAAFAAVGEMNDYAMYYLRNHLDGYNITPENVWLSNPYTVVEQTEHTVQYDYIVLDEDKVIGILVISKMKAGDLHYEYHHYEYHAGLYCGEFTDLQRAYDDNAEIALYTNDAKLYMYDKATDTVYVLSRSDIASEAAPEWLDTDALAISPILPLQ